MRAKCTVTYGYKGKTGIAAREPEVRGLMIIYIIRAIQKSAPPVKKNEQTDRSKD